MTTPALQAAWETAVPARRPVKATDQCRICRGLYKLRLGNLIPSSAQAADMQSLTYEKSPWKCGPIAYLRAFAMRPTREE